MLEQRLAPLDQCHCPLASALPHCCVVSKPICDDAAGIQTSATVHCFRLQCKDAFQPQLLCLLCATTPTADLPHAKLLLAQAQGPRPHAFQASTCSSMRMFDPSLPNCPSYFHPALVRAKPLFFATTSILPVSVPLPNPLRPMRPISYSTCNPLKVILPAGPEVDCTLWSTLVPTHSPRSTAKKDRAEARRKLR